MRKIQTRSLSTTTLSFETFTSKSSQSVVAPTHVIGFLHGILGNKKNWRTPAKAFIQKHPYYSGFTVDLRGHGDSSAVTSQLPPNTVRACSEDLHRLFRSEEFRSLHPQFRSRSVSADTMDLSLVNHQNVVLCGHSFGGKVLLEHLHALTSSTSSGVPAPAVEFTTFILDSIPDIFDPNYDSQLHRHQSVNAIIKLLVTSPRLFPKKEDAMKFLETNGQTRFVSQWLLMNLIPVTENDVIVGWKFCFDIEGIDELFNDFQRLSYWDMLERFNQHTSSPSPNGKIVFVRAGKNPFWKHNQVHERLAEISAKNPHVKYVTMPHVGHWLHSEDLIGLLQVMHPFLPPPQ